MTTPTPRDMDYVRPEPLELTVIAQMRDSTLDLCGPVRVRFTYDPHDPYALTLTIFEMWGSDSHQWVVSREPFCIAALWGVELPGLDMTVTPLTITRATPGQPPRDVPCLRVTLREVTDDGRRHFYTGVNVHLDIVRAEVTAWFTKLTQVVRFGQEHRYMDIDAAIDHLLGRAHKEEL